MQGTVESIQDRLNEVIFGRFYADFKFWSAMSSNLSAFPSYFQSMPISFISFKCHIKYFILSLMLVQPLLRAHHVFQEGYSFFWHNSDLFHKSILASRIIDFRQIFLPPFTPLLDLIFECRYKEGHQFWVDAVMRELNSDEESAKTSLIICSHLH